MTSSLPLDKIKLDGGTQPRGAIRNDVVDDYAAALAEGAKFPPVVVFYDGSEYWLADGFHRVAAFGRNELQEISVDVRQGTRRDAVLYSLGANADHGLQRSDADKRRAIMTMLADEEWASWSDREIARQCRVHHTTVARVRDDVAAFYRGEARDEGGRYRPGREAVYESNKLTQITGDVASMERTFTHPKTGKPTTMDTAKIGKSAASVADDDQATFDRQRQETIDALPADIRAREEAKAERRKSPNSDDSVDLASVIAERDELREANAALEAEVATLRADIAKFETMRVLFEKGGFDAVIAAKDEEIRVLQTRVANESRDKAAWKRSSDHWKAQAERLGINDSISFDIVTGDEVTNG